MQRAAQDSRLKGKALLALGKCFLYDKKAALARAQFERAIPEISFDTDPDSYKEVHYLLGRVCEQVRDFPSAESTALSVWPAPSSTVTVLRPGFSEISQ